jgi:hypothetical protein
MTPSCYLSSTSRLSASLAKVAFLGCLPGHASEANAHSRPWSTVASATTTSQVSDPVWLVFLERLMEGKQAVVLAGPVHKKTMLEEVAVGLFVCLHGLVLRGPCMQ